MVSAGAHVAPSALSRHMLQLLDGIEPAGFAQKAEPHSPPQPPPSSWQRQPAAIAATAMSSKPAGKAMWQQGWHGSEPVGDWYWQPESFGGAPSGSASGLGPPPSGGGVASPESFEGPLASPG